MSEAVSLARLRFEEDKLLLMEAELRQKERQARGILIFGVCLVIIAVGWPFVIWGLLAGPTKAERQAVEAQQQLVHYLREQLADYQNYLVD